MEARLIDLLFEDLVFGVVVARSQLVALVCRKKYKLHPFDLHLLLNLVECNASSFRNAQHTWTPICLPKFDNTFVIVTSTTKSSNLSQSGSG